MSTAVLPARSPNSLSKFMDKVDSAFMEHGLNEVTAPVSKVTQAYGLASDLQMKRMDIPYFSPSLIQSAFYQNTHIFIGARLSTLPESSGISFLNHIGFEEKEYYLVPPLCKEENLFAVGCSVYHVKSSCEKKNYIAHLYPRSYAGFITCWENDWDSSKGKALGSDNVIFTQNSIIHITRFYNCNLMTMADEMRDAFTLRPDWNQFKHEWFYWNFLYFTLPGLESSLLQKCVTGHVEIVFIESLGFRIRCIRRRSEQHEEDMKILKSYNKLFYALLNGIDDLSSRNFSNLFISILSSSL
ncbi:hypothetical protein HMI54_012505 [Coelomomyces lativittatus]|nr:hypothetical protein HMI54_012505 [Coelomomyces lativittatus]